MHSNQGMPDEKVGYIVHSLGGTCILVSTVPSLLRSVHQYQCSSHWHISGVVDVKSLVLGNHEVKFSVEAIRCQRVETVDPI